MGGTAEGNLEASDSLIEIGPGLKLRARQWEPTRATRAAPFLLVHGLASNAGLWDGVGRALASAGHPAVAVDLRGHGLSDKPDRGYDFESVGADLRDLVGCLDLERPLLVGQSWGASVVLETAILYPELSRGVVLVDGHLVDLSGEFPSWEECWKILTPPPSTGLPKDKMERWHRIQHPDWSDEAIEGALGNFEIRPDGTVAPWLALGNHEQIVRSMWDERIAEAWPKVGVPVLIVPVDGNDRLRTESKRAGAAAAVAALRDRQVPVQVSWFKGDHDIHAQHPLELANVLLEACRSGIFAGAV